ncbi:hypothetical protein CCHR01_15797 [Colletotrichum chrysophilum]|uniref:B30.2/SPRY domain-containing protein n=1 Tax=Colletotrichum chrysophilum TaxID=1836956 RepID=A0AAD9EB15_9PEZI|nr:hypothetical protein CCHR01_15797 [Colletotrichum chrysophilum]
MGCCDPFLVLLRPGKVKVETGSNGTTSRPAHKENTAPIPEKLGDDRRKLDSRERLRDENPSTGPLKGPSSTGEDEAESPQQCHGLERSKNLWKKAYEELESSNADLVKQYKKVLVRITETGNDSEIGETENSPSEAELGAAVEKGLERVKKVDAAIEGVGEFAEVVLGCKELISVALTAVPQVAAVWTGMTIVLQGLSNGAKQSVVNREGIQYVASLVRWYCMLFAPSTEDKRNDGDNLISNLRAEFVKLYSKIIEYQMRSVVLYHRNWFIRAIRNALNTEAWDDALRQLKEDEKKVYERLQSYREWMANEELRAIRNCIDNLVNLLECSQNWEISRMIGTFNLEGLDYRAFLEGTRIEQSDTCDWVLEIDGVQNWTHGLLLLTAAPGQGKSVLARFLVKRWEQDGTICHFFFKDDNLVRKKASNAVCAVLHQLLVQHPYVAGVHEVQKKIANGGAGLFGSTSSLWDILELVLKHIDDTVTIVLDGLDECGDGDDGDRKALLQCLQSFSGSGIGKTKILVTSRPIPQITNNINGDAGSFTLVDINQQQKQLSDIIGKVIDKRVEEFPDWSAELQRKIKEKLKGDGSQHTFIWLRLVFEILEQRKTGTLSDENWLGVIEMASDMDLTYKKLLDSVDEVVVDDLMLFFSLIMVAAEPLTVAEINTAMYYSKRAEEGVPGGVYVKDMEKWINANTAFLVTITEEAGGRVQFVHQTAREFLRKREISKHHATNEWFTDEQDAHATILDACGKALQYQTSSQWKPNKHRRDKVSPEAEGLHVEDLASNTDLRQGFLGYALRFYAFHFDKAEVRGGIVYVTAPDGLGRSAVVKLLSRRLQAQASLVVIDNFPGLSSGPEHPTAFYSLMVSTLHHILSQKPSLLTWPVQVLMNELLQKDAWAEGAVENLLSVLFASCDTDFLIVVHDYGSPLWPDVARKWWSGLVDQSKVTRSSGASTCTLLASGTGLQDDKHPFERNIHRLDLTENYEQKKDEFVRQECARILAEIGSASSGFLRGARGQDIQNEIVTRVLSFPGSFGEIGRYLDHLLRGLNLNTPRAIFRSIGPSPETKDEFYCRQVAAILHSMDEELLSWTTAILSWVFKSARPLQAQELAEAVALNRSQAQMTAMDEAVTLDIERDIHTNLAGLFNVENGYVRIASPTAKMALGASGISGLKLWEDDQLVLRCLRYLSMVLGQQPARRAAGTAFVDYAVRFWPAHFSRIINPEESLCTEVARFLRSSSVANQWFRLYTESNDDSQPLTYLQDHTCQPPRDETEDVLGLTPAEMAGHVGLWPMVSFLQVEDDGSFRDGSSLPKMLIRRGGLERQMVFFDGTRSKLYLESAIASDEVQAMRDLVDELDEKTIDSYCPLHLAAFMGSPDMVQMLLEREAVRKSSRNTDERGRTALHMAALGGRLEILKLLQGPLLEGNIDIHSHKDKNSDTPLLLATRAGNVDAAKLLIDLSHMQEVWIDDTRGRCPAHYAIESCPQLLEYLLAGSTVCELIKGDRDGLTLLHLAARSGSVEAVKTILKAAVALFKGSAKIDPDFTSASRQRTERFFTALSEREGPLYSGDEPRQFILSQNLGKWGGHSALLLYPLVRELRGTAENREKVLLDLLLTLNESSYHKPKSSRSRLWARLLRQPKTEYMYEHIHTRLVQILSETDLSTFGRVMLVTDCKGRLAVHHAAESGKREALELLVWEMNDFLEGWGDLMRNHRDLSGNAPGDLAAGRGHIDVLDVLYPGETPIDCSVLVAAAGAGQILVVEYLLQRGVPPNGEPASGRTPLGLASAGGFSQVVHSLLRSGADVNLTSKGRKTPLYLAVVHKRHELVEILLALGDGIGGGAPTTAVVVDTPDSSRLTPLHVAASAGDESLIELLLQRGANVESRSAQRQTPLHLAVKARMQQAAHLLVFKHGASLTTVDLDDKHPVGYAVDRQDAPMVQALLVPTPNGPESGDISSRYPLEFQRRDLITAIERSGLEVFRFLITRYPLAAQPLDITEEPSDSLLHIAARVSNAIMVNQLLSFDLSPNLAGSEGKTPLHVAAASGNVEAVKTLLESQADLSRTDDWGRTPLLLACVGEKDAPETCEALLDGGAAVNDQGQFGRTPLFQASYYGRGEVVRVLLDQRRDADLITAGADINYQKNDGWSPLHMACNWKNPEVVKCLLENGAKANLQSHDGEAPLHIAVRNNLHSIVDIMLGHGRASSGDENATQRPDDGNVVDALARTAEGLSCLDLAANDGSASMLETLLKAADWDYQDLVRPFRKLIEGNMIDRLKPLIEKEGRLLDASLLNGDEESPHITPKGEHIVLPLFHLAIDCGDEDLWRTLVKLDARSKFPGDTQDEDGWTLGDYIHQAQPGAGYIQESERDPIRGIIQKPGAVIFPEAWAGDNSYESPTKQMNIEQNGLVIEFENHSFPPRGNGGSEYRYFEVTILTGGTEDDAIVTIGFCSEFSNMTDAHTGWKKWSVWYHSDDGGLFEQSGEYEGQYKTYQPGSTVGCGIDYAEGNYFFTLDGEIISKTTSSATRPALPAT